MAAKKDIFGHIGQNVMIQDWRIPHDPKLVFIGDNVRMASGVRLITHDVSYKMLNNLPEKPTNIDYKEKKGSIHVGNNVFIGADTTIIYDVVIGDRVIIGAGSVVTKDQPAESVCAGVPCRRIGSFKEFCDKRLR